MLSGSCSAIGTRCCVATARPHQRIARQVPHDQPDAPRATVTDVDTQHVPRKTCPQRTGHRIRARYLTYGSPQVTIPILLSSGTGSVDLWPIAASVASLGRGTTSNVVEVVGVDDSHRDMAEPPSSVPVAM